MTVRQAFTLAVEHHQAGRLTEAEALYRQIIALEPGGPEAWYHLGIIALRKGRPDLAMQWIKHALVLRPNYPAALYDLGIVLSRMDRLDEAVESYRRALQLQPAYPEACNNLAIVLARQGRVEEALAIYQRALELRPDFHEVHGNIGTALAGVGRRAEAIAAYRRALELKPDYIDAQYSIGVVLVEEGRVEEAVEAFRRTLQLKPDHVEAHNNLGFSLFKLGELDEAVQACGRALELKPDHLAARSNLGGVLVVKGQLDAAIGEFREAMRLHPRSAPVHSNLIYALQFHHGYDDRMIAMEEQQWNRQFGVSSRRDALSQVNDRNPERRLRVGYVSPHLREHVVGRNLLPLFLHRDHRNVEVYCYSDAARPDECTAQFREQTDHWRPVAGISDDALAQMIREDGVDILVDLTLHMEGNRLPVFVHRPAPVQVSFAGYPASAGVDAIPNRISDPYLESKIGVRSSKIGFELLSSISDLRPAEQVHLIDSFWCYQTFGSEIAVNEIPADKNGYITFGSFNNFCKVNEPLLRLWARVMSRVSDSRLILLSGKGAHRQAILDLLGCEGIEAKRIEFVELLPRPDYFEQYHRVDVVLDSFPYNGHTTSLDALWMGVPVVSLAGERSVSRAGLSQLSNLGLPELAVFSEEDYVETAARLAADFSRLAELRATLRCRMEASVIMDAPRFARNIESAYRAMWRRWCGHEASTSP